MKYLFILIFAVLISLSFINHPNIIHGYPYKVVTNDYYNFYYDRLTYCVNDLTGDQWVQSSLGMYNLNTGYAPYEICTK